MFEKVAHYNFRIKAISEEDNEPADVMSRLANTTAELPDVDHYNPVQKVEV